MADAAGVDRFAWFGYSWGGVVGLPLAARTNRLSALICGGWPPIGASYYRGLEQWRDQEVVARFTCPRVGRDDSITTAGTTVRIGPLVAERQAELD